MVTEAGRSLLTEVLPGHLALIETSLLESLRRGGPDELDAFVTALRRLRDHLAPCSTAGSEGPLPAQPDAAARPGRAGRPEPARPAGRPEPAEAV